MAALLFLAWLTDRDVLLWPAFAARARLCVGALALRPLGGRRRLVVAFGARRLGAPVGGLYLDRRRDPRSSSSSGRPHRSCAARLSSRFSRLATGLVGARARRRDLPRDRAAAAARDLWTHDYGRVLLVKLALVALALAWGAFHHFAVRPALAGRATSCAAAASPGRSSARAPSDRRPARRRGARRLEAAAPAHQLPDRQRRIQIATRWAISGGAGFLGLHLARRLLERGESVRTLDLAPLDDTALEREVDEVRGDVRDASRTAKLCSGADVLVHAAAALPIQVRRRIIWSVNVGGTATVLRAALEAGVTRVVVISSTAVYGVPKVHPIDERAPLVGVGHYGRSKIAAEGVAREFARRGLELVIVRPKTFIGPERLGVFEILFDWVREGRRIYVLGDGSIATSCLRSRTSSRRSWPPPARPCRRAPPSTSARRSSAPSARISAR